jgi:glycosyltransferase involved in cell wall biosynthesis
VIPPRLSVLVCTRNRTEKARRAIDSILRNSFADFELLVVDQSTDGRTRTAVEAFDDPRIRYIEMNATGLAKARNLAIQASYSEIVAFTDDDCICDSDWLASIVAEYDCDPTARGIFGRVLPYGEIRQDMYCPATMDSTDRRTVDRPTIPTMTLGGGNNMSFKKSVFREIGVFIETLGAGTKMKSGEDTEFVYRALRKRIRFVYSPRPLVYHDNWMTDAEFAELMCDSLLGTGAVFTKFLLHMDRGAGLYLLKTGHYVLHNRIGAGSVRAGVTSLISGMLMGVRYRFERPPIAHSTASV